MRGAQAQQHARDAADEVRARCRLDTAAARYGVALRAQGREMVGCCPFHAETTPSFKIFRGHVSDRYYCFGCGASGDVIEFVRLMECVSRAQAVFLMGRW